MTPKSIKLYPLTLAILTAISASSLFLGSGSAFANPGDYALQPTCPKTPDSSGTICYTPQTAPVLKVGSRGKMVLNIQNFLKFQGYLSATPNGIYGELTRAAVIKFQRANRLTPDGVFGSASWRAYMRTNAG